MKPIGKDGKVWRLSKESWDILLPYDSDPNVALKKIQAELETKRALDLLPAHPAYTAPQPILTPHPCKFDEGAVVTAIKQGIKETLESFRE